MEQIRIATAAASAAASVPRGVLRAERSYRAQKLAVAAETSVVVYG